MNRWLWSAIACVVASTVIAADAPQWPRFRGPNGSGIAEGQKPPAEFGPEKNLKFKVPVPSGLSSPIIAADKLFLTAFADGKLYTIAYSTADGKELWRQEAPAKTIEPFQKIHGSPAASSVATDGKLVVSYFGSCGLFAYDTAGKFLWKYDLPTAQTAADFGTGVSPILADGLVVLLRDEMKEPKILALDAADGSRKWEKKRQSPTSYCTPVVWETGGKKEIVCGGFGKMVSYDLTTGDEIWSVAGMPSACCASPVVADGVLYFAGWSPGDAEDKEFQMPKFDDLLKADADKDGALSKAEVAETMLKDFFDNNDSNKDGKLTREEWDATLNYMKSGKNSAFAVKAGGKGDVTKTHVLWKGTKGLPYVPSGILYGGQLLMVKDGGLVTAYDAKTGKVVYETERLGKAGGMYYASPVAANGHIYLASLEEGIFTVLKAGADSPEVVHTVKLGERTSATPAIADNTLYVRTAKHLWAFAATK